MFNLVLTTYFAKKLKKLVSKNQSLKEKVKSTLLGLAENPNNPKLRSHKVSDVYSSRVTGDIRIIWQYGKDGEIQIRELLDIGGHSGAKKVY